MPTELRYLRRDLGQLHHQGPEDLGEMPRLHWHALAPSQQLSSLPEELGTGAERSSGASSEEVFCFASVFLPGELS